MMGRLMYALVRCVPDPRTGEFVNMGAIVGDPESGEWAVRTVENTRRVRRLASVDQVDAVRSFVDRVVESVNLSHQGTVEGNDPQLLGEDWLHGLYHDHRNVVQLSPPAPILAKNPQAALDLLFNAGRVIDPPSTEREMISSTRVFSNVLKAYRHAQIDEKLVRRRVEVYVGQRLHTDVDFAVANGTALQLTQAMSFQRKNPRDIARDVKSWAYALRSLRDGEPAVVLAGDNAKPSSVASDVDIRVVVAGPQTSEQKQVYAEAEVVFHELGVNVHSFNKADEVADEAAKLIAADRHKN